MAPVRLFPYLLSIFAIFVCAPLAFLYADESYSFDESAEIPAVYFSKYTWLTSTHPKVASFTWLPNGDSYGITTTGVPFRQYSVPTVEGIRVQRFELQDHFHYIVEGTIIGSLEALSVHLASAYNALR